MGNSETDAKDIVLKKLKSYKLITEVGVLTEKNDAITYQCMFRTRKRKERNIYVACNMVNDEYLMVTFYCILDKDSRIRSFKGYKVANELSSKFKYCKAYVEDSANDGENGSIMYCQYDTVLPIQNKTIFENTYTNTQHLVFSIFSDCIEVEDKSFQIQESEENVVITPDPF